MKKGTFTALFLATAAVTVPGCSSIQMTSNMNGRRLTEGDTVPEAHIHSDVWGIYFLGFQCLPVITGSARDPGSFHFFKDTVTTNAAAEMVTRKSEELGAGTVTDLTTDWSSSWQTYTLLFWLKEAQASGNAVSVPPAPHRSPPETAGANETRQTEKAAR